MIQETININFKYDGKLQFNNEISKEIEDFWNNYKIKNPKAYNEKILTVTDISNIGNKYEVIVKDALFSDILFSKLKGKIKTRCLFSGGYIVTKDNYIILVLNNKSTLNEKNVLDLVGGMSNINDIIDGKYKSENCIKREFREELGINIDNINFTYNIRFIKYPSIDNESEKYYPVGTIYEIKTNYTRDELTDLFNNSIRDGEVKRLIYFSKDNYKDILKYDYKKEYILELWQKLFEEVK